MKKMLLVPAALGLAATGCATLETKSTAQAVIEPAQQVSIAAPALPTLRTISDAEVMPALDRASSITVSFCKQRGTYVAAGIDLSAKRFTFLIQGNRATQEAAFSRFFESGVPVTVYTQPVKVQGRTATVTPAPTTTPVTPVPTPVPSPPSTPLAPSETRSQQSTDNDLLLIPCISDPPPGGSTKNPTGEPPYVLLSAFRELAWQTAQTVNTVSRPAAPITLPTATH